MPKRSSIQVAEFAASVAAIESGTVPNDASGKNPFAVALGRRGGLKGGPARAATLTKERRQAIAKKAAKVRWAGK